jgi:hypothetical protein
VPSTQMQWRIKAIFRAIASFIPEALREDHFFVR